MLKWAVRRELIATSALVGINAKEDLPVSPSAVLFAKEGEVRKDAGEVVALVASATTARPGHGDATDQRDRRAVVKRPCYFLARMRVEERAGKQVERSCAAFERKFAGHFDARQESEGA
jgi:hypothetical protein